ncbi:hypothetical protein IWQ62_005596 [Dispira parvispora]|uniref:Major facilitator superfamily (MFS) profile domain-containing protein n=1 Tax=Dispira parvispora TaxID=1520584 RepID=A0A9W8DZG9_9FUNG|nr:hypothetical protein IWQ62_005596 [Dispira parvispora]
MKVACCRAICRLRRQPTTVLITVSLAIFIDLLLYGLVLPVFPSVLQGKVDDVSVANAILGSCYALGTLVGSIVAGRLSDILQRRQVLMCGGLALMMICTLALGLCTTFWQMILARLPQGLASGVTWSLGFSMLADVYPEEKLGMVMGVVTGANVIGQMAGPGLGGLLYYAGGQYCPFAFGAGLTLVDLIFRVVVGETIHWREVSQSPAHAISPGEPKSDIVSVRSLLGNWKVVVSCISTVGMTAIMAVIDTLLPIHLEERFPNMNSAIIGAIFTALFLPMAIVSPLTGRALDRWQPNLVWVTQGGLLLVSIVFPVLALPRTVILEVVVLVLFGIVTAVALTPVTPLLSTVIDPKVCNSYGTVYGLYTVSSSLGLMVGPLFSVTVYQFSGFLSCTLLIASSTLALALIMVSVEVFLWRRARKRVLNEDSDAILTTP